MQVADYTAPFSSNFLASLCELARRVRAELGLSSVLVFPRSAADRPWVADLTSSGLAVRFVNKEASHRGRSRELARVAEEFHAQVLHAHFGTFDLDAGYVARRLGCGSVWHMHSPYPVHDTLRKRLGESVKFRVGSRLLVDRIVAVSPSVAESAIAHGGPRDRMSVILNGIDVPRFRPPEPARRVALRHRLGIPEGATVFLLFGWSPRRKGVDLAVEASKALRSAGRRPFLILVVGGEPTPPELEGLVRNEPSIRTVTTVPDAADLYGTADCLISASRAEGLPYAVGEAMAAQRVVISSDLPQIVEAYGAAGAGLLTFRTGDAQSLAETMARVLEMPPDERSRLGAANASFVSSHLSLAEWSGQVLEIYRTVLEARGQVPPSTRSL